MTIDFKSLMSGAGSAQITAGIADLDQQARTVSAQRSETEANRRASLAELDDDRVDELDGRLRAWDRELERIAEQRRQLKARLEEVQQEEKSAALDKVYAEGQAAQAEWREASGEYDRHAPATAKAIEKMNACTARVMEAKRILAEAKDPRKLKLPAGLLAEERGEEYRLDLAKTVILPAVVGQRHFWPKPR